MKRLSNSQPSLRAKRGNLREKGLTLIEMLVVLALIGLIMGSATAAIYAIIKSSSISNEQNVALRQVQNAGFWITRDVLQADDEPTLGVGTGFPISMQYYEWESGTDFTLCTVDYSFDGDKLERQVNCDTAETIMIADYIDLDNTSIIYNDVDNTYKLTVKAVFGKAEVTRTYEIERRLE